MQNAALAPNGETLEGHTRSLALRLPPSLPQALRFAAAAASLATIYGARISPGSISRTGHFISSEALVSVWGAGISSCAGGPTWMLAPVMTSHSSLSEAISSLKIPIRNVESSSLPASFSPSGAGISKTTSAILPAPGNHLSPSWMSPFSTLKMAVVIPASGASPRAEAKSSPGPSQKTAVPSSPNAAAAATAGFFTAYMNMENLRKSVADEMRSRVFHLHAAAPRGARGAMCQVGGARRIGCRAFPGNGGPVLVIYP